MAIRIDVVVVVIDRVRESVAFAHFVGMLVGSCFNRSDFFEKGKWEVQNPNPKMCITRIEGKYAK